MSINSIPLAERMRPKILREIVGHDALIGQGGAITKMIAAKNLSSLILWGPPGTGKTTIAEAIAHEIDLPFYRLSAISAGVKDVRNVIQIAQKQGKAILFIDEIHRFNKAQQDALLGAVEKGTITLIGATTENPSFEVISALISRSQVFVLESLGLSELLQLLNKAIKHDEWLKTKNVSLKETDALIRLSSGDGRKLLNLLELVVAAAEEDKIVITNVMVAQAAQKPNNRYYKDGEQHYDIVSALIKSIRGSDPNAAIYWLARMIEGGEDPKFIARRLLISASEDIGNANPTALVLAESCFGAVEKLGYPECAINLAQCVSYLASSPKSNASYLALKAAMAEVKNNGDLEIPLHLRNAPTKLMKQLDYGKNYEYAHDYPNNFVMQEYLPNSIRGKSFYRPGNNARENEFRKRLSNLWESKYDFSQKEK